MEQILFFSAMAIIYFIPSFFASGKKGSDGIVALNIFAGWTGIGWLAALIWALCAENRPVKKVQANYEAKLSLCPYCKVETKTIYTPNSEIMPTSFTPRCKECLGIKD